MFHLLQSNLTSLLNNLKPSKPKTTQNGILMSKTLLPNATILVTNGLTTRHMAITNPMEQQAKEPKPPLGIDSLVALLLLQNHSIQLDNQKEHINNFINNLFLFTLFTFFVVFVTIFVFSYSIIA